MNARSLACACSLGALLALTGCEKPTPIVTVVNEGRSTYAEASSWCFEGQTGDECVTAEEDATALRVLGGTLGVDVDREVADAGWRVTLVDVAQPEEPLFRSEVLRDKHYYTLTLPELPSRTRLLLTVEAVTEGGEPGRGTWEFALRAR